MNSLDQARLKNYLVTHQTIQSKILSHDYANETQRSHLKKLLEIYQNQVKQLSLRKKPIVNKNRNSSSSYFSFGKKKNSICCDKQQKLFVLQTNSIQKNKKKYVFKKSSSNFLSNNGIGIVDDNNDDDDNGRRSVEELTNALWADDDTSSNDQFSNNITNDNQLERDENNQEQSKHDSQQNTDDNNSISSNVDNLSDQQEQEKVEDTTTIDNNNVNAVVSAPVVVVRCDGHGKNLSEKNDFMRLLELIHKSEYNSIVNCKKSRTRRTTANPQFSHAAIEAKRITKLEMANERKNRKQIIDSKITSLPVKKVNNKNTSNNKTLHLITPDDKMNYLTSLDVFRNENELFPGLFGIGNEFSVEQNCKICSSQCNFSSDTIVVCKKCVNIFHLNCLEHKFLFPELIKCPVCNPNWQQENFTGIDDLVKKLVNIRLYISLLHNANYYLDNFLEEKNQKKEKLTLHMIELSKNFSRIKNIIQTLKHSDENISNNNFDSLMVDNDNDNDDPDDEKNMDYESESSQTRFMTIQNSTTINGSSDVSLLDDCDYDESDNNSSVQSSPSLSKINQKSNANPKCEQEFSIVSSWA